MDQAQVQDQTDAAVDSNNAAPSSAPAQEYRSRDRFSDRGDRGDRGDRYGDRGDRGERRPESFEQMLRKFKKGVDNAGILKEVRARSFFESKSQKARRKAAKAARRRTRSKSRTGE